MNIFAETAPLRPASAANEPAVWVILLIFWGVFSAAISMLAVLNPDMFVRVDPDSLLHLVQARDLVAGQGWFDLMQHRMDPPDGMLMHWSRVTDAPIAALIVLGGVLGIGDGLALTVWPLLLLLGLMAGAMLSATALAGRKAAVAALILSLVFLNPLLFFLPNDIDHHNAQYALTALSLAMALRLAGRPMTAAAHGACLALMLAIGLETLPYVAIFGAIMALRWAFRAIDAHETAAFGLVFAAASAAFYLLTGSPAAPFACDSLSWSYALPAAIAGGGLAGLALVLRNIASTGLRLAALGGLGAASVASLLLVAPGCLGGPYGALSAETRALWLDTVTEAQPLFHYAARQPVSAIATIGPPIVALVVALLQVRSGDLRRRQAWAIPSVLLGATLALSFYQVRTLPYANLVAIAVLGAWLAEVAARTGMTSFSKASLGSKAALSLFVGVLVSCPLAHLALGWSAVKIVSLVSGGRIAPPESTLPVADTQGLSNAQKECLDPESAMLFARASPGQVLSPVFYGSAVLTLSEHSVVAGPYHRAENAILDAIQAMQGSPEQARAIVDRRKIDYIAVCSTSTESAIAQKKAPDGLLAALLSGKPPAWVEPIPAERPTALKFWRVTDGGAPAQTRQIGIGGSFATPPLPYHRTYGPVPGGSAD